MAILIDADVIIQAERGLFDLDRWLNHHPDEEFVLAAITVAELWHGAERATGSHRAKRQAFLEAVFSMFDILPYTASTGFEHARVWAKLESNGRMIGAHDLILAAIALQTNNTVATFNRRHFSVVKGLKVIEPS